MELCENDYTALCEGRAPLSADINNALSTGFTRLTDFWRDRYLNEFIREGGSRIKFISGRPGCGKTHFLRLLAEEGRKAGYQVVTFSAKDVWLHDFREIYREIVRQCDLALCLDRAAEAVIRGMGYNPADIPEGTDFMTYLSGIGEGDALNRRAIRMELKETFLKKLSSIKHMILSVKKLLSQVTKK